MQPRQWKGFLYLLIFNILVSGTVTLAVLYYWDQNRLGTQMKPPTPVVIYVAVTGTPPTLDPALALLLPSPTFTPDQPLETPTKILLRLEPYLVQPGDSLGVIAERFGVSVADLLAVNDLDDPDRLLVGQELLIPSGPLPTSTRFIPSATATPTASATPPLSPTPTLTPTRTPNLEEPVVEIETILGAGDLTAERVKIVQRRGRDVSLAGWTLEDEQGNQFTFPQLILRQGGVVYLHTRSGANTASDLYWGKSAPIWQSKETAILKDASGAEIARFQVP